MSTWPNFCIVREIHLGSLKTVRKIYKLWRGKDKSPELSLIEFNKILDTNSFNVNSIFLAFTKNDCRQFFDEVKLNIFEFLAVGTFASYSNYSSKLKMMFLLFDLDSSGKIDPNQMLLACKSFIFGYCRLVNCPLPPFQALTKSIQEVRSVSEALPHAR